MIYIIEIRIPDESEHRIVEESADDFLFAAKQLARRWPGVHLDPKSCPDCSCKMDVRIFWKVYLARCLNCGTRQIGWAIWQ